MYARISASFSKNASGRNILILMAGIILLNATLFSNMSASMAEGTRPIDLMFFYTPDQVYAMVDAYGPDLRPVYARFELTADILYPILYTLFFCLTISWLFERGFDHGSAIQRLNLLPLGAGLFDFLENFSIVAMLTLHPAQPAAVAWAATLFTMAKWLFALAALVLVLIGIAAALRKRASG